MVARRYTSSSRILPIRSTTPRISTNTCLLLNAKTRMANSPTTPPLRCFLFRRWSIAARNSFEHLVPPNTNCTLFCSPGKIPQAECAYHQRWYLASCGEESHRRTKAARLLPTQPRIANSPTLTIFKVAVFPFAANSPTSLPLGLLLTSNLLGLAKSFRISPSWQYTALAVYT